MNKLPLVAVVIPVYNVAPYLKECIDSVIAQTYTNYLCVIVDDGSTDQSPSILEEIKSELLGVGKEHNFIFLHKPNGGLSSARNYALDYLESLQIEIDYITFIDSDDYVKPNLLEEYINTLTDNQADIAICAYTLFDKCGIIKEKRRPTQALKLTNLELIQYIYSVGKFSIGYNWTYRQPDNAMGTIMWNKCFKYSYIDKHRFDKRLSPGEDDIFWLKIIPKCSCGIIIPICLYLYRMRKSSIMHVKNNLLSNYLVIDLCYNKVLTKDKISSELYNLFTEISFKTCHFNIIKNAIIEGKLDIANKFFTKTQLTSRQLNLDTSWFYLEQIYQLFYIATVHNQNKLAYIFYKYLISFYKQHHNKIPHQYRNKMLRLKLGFHLNKLYFIYKQLKKVKKHAISANNLFN